VRVVVPYAVREPKTRLSGVLDADERRAFARAMLADVLAAVLSAGASPEVLATARMDLPDCPADADPVSVTVDERPLTPAVEARLPGANTRAGSDTGEAGDGTGDGPVAVVMADLALATPGAVGELLDAHVPGGVTLVPGRGGGTNAMVVDVEGFAVDYHGVSYRDHLRSARAVDAPVETVDSFRLSTDVDDPTDLPEVLLHGGPRSRGWLRRQGFRLASTDGRVTATRDAGGS
jgi:2-phospho-L-lactate guanylyltransferase